MSRTILEEALVVAQSQLGVREKPLGSNRGPEVDVYIESVGLAPTGKYAWCAAFVYWCYKRAAEQLQVKNPAAKTGGSLMQWTLASMRHCYRLTTQQALTNPLLIKPGMVFVMKFSNTTGHTGIVESVDVAKKTVTSIEGNTNDDGSREGYEVARRTRTIESINVGFIDFSQSSKR